MKCLVVVLCTLGLVGAPSPIFNKITTKIALWAFRKFLESAFKGNGIANLFPLRGMVPPEFNPEEYSGKFQGDIILDDPTIDAMFNQFAISRRENAPDIRWPNNTVVWQFNDNHFDQEQRDAIQDSIDLIEKNTCVTFRLRKPGEKVYVNVSGNSTGCYSVIGHHVSRGMHVLNLAPHPPGNGCLRIGTIVHQWMHILGFHHMHSAHDRDGYVRIVADNIMPGTLIYFASLGTDQESNLGVEYDYLSCLHYSAFAFSANGNATIEALKKFDGVMGQRYYVTDLDWLRINRFYNCPGVIDSPLCRACMEPDETPAHVLRECTGVADQRRVYDYWGSSTSLPELLGNLGGLLGFWRKLGWLD